MDRLACVEVACLPVQMLCRRPGWARCPVAWVDRDAATGRVLQVNDRAAQAGIRPGMRYARALSLSGQLRAAPMPEAELAEQVAALTKRLQDFSPEVEAAEDPGRFWLNGRGLARVFGRPQHWGDAIRDSLREMAFCATVVVGYSRFATAALARVGSGVRVLRNPAEERAVIADLPVASVIQEPEVLETLAKLDVRTVGELERLPAASRIARFGRVATLPERTRRFSPGQITEPLTASHYYGDETVLDRAVLLATAERLLEDLLPRLRAQMRKIAALELRLELVDRELRELTVTPAESTLEAASLLRLLDLRLERETLPCGVAEMRLTVQEAKAEGRQPSLFAVRDLEAANRALTELRTRFGPDAVVHAELRDSWLPGTDFCWQPLQRLAAPFPAATLQPRLVRRLLETPRDLPGHDPTRAPLRDLRRQHGPFHMSSHWWDDAVEQSQYYAECGDGELAWVIYDPVRHCWRLLGQVD